MREFLYDVLDNFIAILVAAATALGAIVLVLLTVILVLLPFYAGWPWGVVSLLATPFLWAVVLAGWDRLARY